MKPGLAGSLFTLTPPTNGGGVECDTLATVTGNHTYQADYADTLSVPQLGLCSNANPSVLDCKPVPSEGSLLERIKREWEVDKGLSGIIWDYAVILSDESPDQGDSGVPTINEFLGFAPRSKWKRDSRFAVAFSNEDGSPWQLKPYGGDQLGGPKYLGARGGGDTPYLPRIPGSIIEKICCQFSVNPPAKNMLTWDWLTSLPKEIKEHLPIIVTEGAAKCLAAMKQGYLSISLYGCQCYPEKLQTLLKDFRVVIAFDSDTKETAKRAVKGGICALYHGKKHRGKTGLKGIVSSFSVASWKPELGKGLDDLLVHNPHLFTGVIEGALPFPDWKRLAFKTVKRFEAGIEVDQKYIGDTQAIDFDETDGQQILSLALGKGRGKTKRIARIIEGLKARGEKVLVIGHRISLGLQNAALFQIDYKGQNSGKRAGYACCFDSLLETAGFYPEDYTGAYLILDEATQGVAHLLLSKTLKDNRTKVLENFVSLVKTCKGMVLADADLKQSDIDFIASMFSKPPIQKTYFDTFTPEKKIPFYLLENNALVISQLDTVLQENPGAKVLIHTDSKTGKFGTQTLEEKYKRQGLKVLRLDADTFNLEGHAANKIKAFLEIPENSIADYMASYDIVVVSPAVGTGWSIEPRDSELFQGVFILGNGVSDLDSLCQSFMRYRSNVARYAAIPLMGLNYYGGKETDPSLLRRHIQERGKVAAGNLLNLVEQKDRDPMLKQWHKELSEREILTDLKDLFYGDVLGGDGVLCQTIFNYSLGLMCEHNSQQLSLRESVLERLDSERCWDVIEVGKGAFSSEETQPISKELGELKDGLIDILVDKLAGDSLKPLPPDEYSMVESKSPRTEWENLSLQKTSLCRKYPLPDLPLADRKTLIKKDLTQRGFYQGLRTRYYLTVGRKFLPYRDLRSYLSSTHGGKKMSRIDLLDSQLFPRVLALELCNIEQFLTPGAEFTQANLADWYRTLLDYRHSIRANLGVSMVKESSHLNWVKKNKKGRLPSHDWGLDPSIHKPIDFAQRLLSLVGLHLICGGRVRTPEGQVRLYQLDTPDPIESLIVSNWHERDLTIWEVEKAAIYRDPTSQPIPNQPPASQPPCQNEGAVLAFFGGQLPIEKKEPPGAETHTALGFEGVPSQDFLFKQITERMAQPQTPTIQGFEGLQGAEKEMIPYIGGDTEYPPDGDDGSGGGGCIFPIETPDPDCWEDSLETFPSDNDDDSDYDWGDYQRAD